MFKSFQRKKTEIFPCGVFLFRVVDDCLSECPNSKKTPLPWKIPGYSPGRYRITTAVIRIIEKPYPGNNLITQSRQQKAWNKMWNLLKVNSRDCVSLLTNCNISKTFFQVFFWCTVNMSFSCSFLILYCQFKKDFTCLDIPFLLSALKDVLSHVLGRLKVNNITKRSYQ